MLLIMKSSSQLRSVPAPISRPRISVPRSPARPLGVVGQVRLAMKPRNRLATSLGAILGGFVPTASYTVAHHELDLSRPLTDQIGTVLVLGGLLFSAITVVRWGRQAFQSTAKAVGFVALTEGVLVASQTQWLALSALAILVGVNAIATGSILSRDGRP